MRSFDDIDELRGDPALRAFADDVRVYASGPAPTVGPDLAAVLAGGIGAGAPPPDPAVVRPGPVEAAHRRLRHRLQGRRGRLVLGASVLSLTFLGTGAAGALPGRAQAAFEHTAEVVGIELPEEAREDDAPPPDEPAPVEPGDRGGPDDGGEAPPPLGEREPGPAPGDDGGSPAPTNPPAGGDGRPGAPDGAGTPGDDLGRDPREGVPEGVPAPVSPSPPGPPDALPGGPPDGVPGRGPSERSGTDGDDDPEEESDGEDEQARVEGSITPGPPPGVRPAS